MSNLFQIEEPDTIGVFAVISNCGDGSNCLHWFDGREVSIEELQELEEHDPETWGSGNGLQVSYFTFPKYFDFESVGIQFSNIKNYRVDLDS